MTIRKVMVSLGGLALTAILTILSPQTEVKAAEVTGTDKVMEMTALRAAEEFDITEKEAWEDMLLVDVSTKLNIRESASEKGRIIGALKKNEIAEILETEEKWTRISFDGLEGYVSNDYILTGEEAYAYAMEEGKQVASVTAHSLLIREAPSRQAEKVGSAQNGELLLVDTEAEETEGWVAVLYQNTTCYVSADFVEQSYQLVSASDCAGGAGYACSSDDVYLLAALIECEAGGTSYEGMLAVGSCVMNRIASSSFPNTISEVIYQKSQFSPASSGLLAGRLASGNISEDAYAAARAALSGTSNTSCLYFWAASSGHYGTRIGGNVFF